MLDRSSTRRFTTLTNAVLKKIDNLRHAVALHFHAFTTLLEFTRPCGVSGDEGKQSPIMCGRWNKS